MRSPSRSDPGPISSLGSVGEWHAIGSNCLLVRSLAHPGIESWSCPGPELFRPKALLNTEGISNGD